MTLEQLVLPSSGRISYLLLLLRKAAHTELCEPAAGLLLPCKLIWITLLQGVLLHRETETPCIIQAAFKLKKIASDQELLAAKTKLMAVSIFSWFTCPNSKHKNTQDTSYDDKAGLLHAFSPHKINAMWTCFFTVHSG